MQDDIQELKDVRGFLVRHRLVVLEALFGERSGRFRRNPGIKEVDHKSEYGKNNKKRSGSSRSTRCAPDDVVDGGRAETSLQLSICDVRILGRKGLESWCRGLPRVI
jgi:hypothetical protein